MKTVTPIPLTPESKLTPSVWYMATAGLYDATSGGNPVTTDGTVVKRVEDQSGNAANATHATGPVLKLNQVNGYPTLRFSNVGTTRLTLPSMAAYTAGTVIMVFKFLDNVNTIYGHMGDPNNSAIWWDGNNSVYETFGTNDRKFMGVMPAHLYWTTGFRIYCVQAKAADFIVRMNNRPFWRTTTNTVSFPAVPILGAGSAGGVGNYDLAEFVLFNSFLTQPNLDKWHRYLENKYSLYV